MMIKWFILKIRNCTLSFFYKDSCAICKFALYLFSIKTLVQFVRFPEFQTNKQLLLIPTSMELGSLEI